MTSKRQMNLKSMKLIVVLPLIPLYIYLISINLINSELTYHLPLVQYLKIILVIFSIITIFVGIYKYPNFITLADKTILDTHQYEKLIKIVFPKNEGKSKRFNKFILLRLKEDLESSFNSINFEWLNCKLPMTIDQYPKNCKKSDINNANMVRCYLNDKLIFESYEYRISKCGYIFLYLENLNQIELSKIDDIFKRNGFEAPQEKINKNKKIEREVKDRVKNYPSQSLIYIYGLIIFSIIFLLEKFVQLNILLGSAFAFGLIGITIYLFLDKT